MKFVWILVLVVILSYDSIAAESGNKLQSETKACFTANGITKEEYLTAKKAQFQNATPKIQCLIDCYAKKIGLIKDGQIQDAFAVRYITKKKTGISPSAVTQLLGRCKSSAAAVTNTPCGMSYNLFQCMGSNSTSTATAA